MNNKNTYTSSKANPITRLANSFPPVTLGFADREQLEEQRISSEYEKFRTSPTAKITEPTIDEFNPKEEATAKPVNLNIEETAKLIQIHALFLQAHERKAISSVIGAKITT